MRHLRTTVATLAAGLVLSTIPAGTATAAPAAGADSGADWLSRQLTGGLIHNAQFEFDDYGLTADTAIALAEIGGHEREVAKIRRALAKNVESWTTGADFGMSDVYAGSTAKAVVLAQTAGANPKKFGGTNLVKQLNKLVSTTKPTVGRIEDATTDTDYANVIGQALAVRGLDRAKSGKADEALRFLLKQQCDKGYFRLDFSAKTGSQTCDSAPRSEAAPDTDVTAMAVLTLSSLRKQTRKVKAATADAVRWLKRQQKDNGSFGGGPTTSDANANSTGLAGWALGTVGACRPAVRAAQWLGKLQVTGKVAGTPLAGEEGAIAYDRASLKAARRDGIELEQQDQWRRATSQAAPALLNLTLRDCRTS